MNPEIYNYIVDTKAKYALSWYDMHTNVNIKFGTNYTSGEALRSSYRRFKRKSNRTSEPTLLSGVEAFADALRTLGGAFGTNTHTSTAAPVLAAPSSLVGQVPISLPMLFDAPLKLDKTATLVLADLHCPYHHGAALQAALKTAQDYSVAQIVIAGDLLDLDVLSKHSKAHNIARLEAELEITGQILLYLSAFAPVYICQGNHDARFFDKLDTQLSFQRLISAALNGRSSQNAIKTTDRDYLFIGDHFMAGHLDKFSSTAGKNAYAAAQKFNRHVLAGHDHVTGVYKVNPSAKYMGASIGCMADSSKFWYSERRMNAMPFMQRGYAVISNSSEDDFYLFDQNHACYFERSHGFNSFAVV